MKKILFFVAVLFVGLSCSKKDVTPTLADQVAGNYTLSQIVSGGQTVALPYNQGGDKLSGTVTITKKTDTQVNVSMTVNTVISGKSDTQTQATDYNLSQNGTKIDFYDPATKTTDISFTSNTLTFDDGNGSKITAKKN